MKDVMLDIETLSTQKDAAIASIGAVQFDLRTGDLGVEFYQVIDLQSCTDAGLHFNGATVAWWLGQSHEARAALLVEGRASLFETLEEFCHWFPNDGRCWGNGASFDCVITRNAIEARANRELASLQEKFSLTSEQKDDAFEIFTKRTLKNRITFLAEKERMNSSSWAVLCGA